MPSNRAKRLLHDWMRSHTVKIHKEVKMIKTDFPSYGIPIWELTEWSQTVVCNQVDAIEMTVAVEEMARLLEDSEKFQQLMRLPEVRQALFYHTLSGDFDAE